MFPSATCVFKNIPLGNQPSLNFPHLMNVWTTGFLIQNEPNPVLKSVRDCFVILTFCYINAKYDVQMAWSRVLIMKICKNIMKVPTSPCGVMSQAQTGQLTFYWSELKWILNIRFPSTFSNYKVVLEATIMQHEMSLFGIKISVYKFPLQNVPGDSF